MVVAAGNLRPPSKVLGTMADTHLSGNSWRASCLLDYVTPDGLVDHGLTPADMRRCCPHAVEYSALHGGPCWLWADLTPLLAETGGAL
jgi:hypothetical protein